MATQPFTRPAISVASSLSSKPRRLGLREVENVVDDVQQMGAAAVDVGGILPVALIAQGAIELVPQDLGKADDGVERRAQFVAHIGEEFRFRPVGALRQFLGFLQLPFRALAIGDIDHHAVEEFLLAVAGLRHHALLQDPADRPVAMDGAELQRIGRAMLDRLQALLDDHRPVVGMDAIDRRRHLLPDDLSGAVAGDRLHHVAQIDMRPIVERRAIDRAGNIAHQRTELRFALPEIREHGFQAQFRFPLLGDIRAGAAISQEISGGIEVGSPRDAAPSNAAVAGAVAEYGIAELAMVEHVVGVPGPGLGLQRLVKGFEWRLAQEGLAVRLMRVERLAAIEGEPQTGIQFPQPIRRYCRHVVQARLRLAQLSRQAWPAAADRWWWRGSLKPE